MLHPWYLIVLRPGNLAWSLFVFSLVALGVKMALSFKDHIRVIRTIL